jgi:alpha-beta hydrolase superfamily lysophospholipase
MHPMQYCTPCPCPLPSCPAMLPMAATSHSTVPRPIPPPPIFLAGNGRSEKPKLMGQKGRWWTIDDNVSKDVPALVRFVQLHTQAAQVHFVGHSMGGMILTGVMAQGGDTARRIRSCTLLGSGCFLKGRLHACQCPLPVLTGHARAHAFEG